MTDHTPAEAVQYWYDAAVERREERNRLRAAVARIRQMTDYWEQHLPEVIRTPAVVSALRAAMEPAPSAEPVPPADQTAEIDRLRTENERMRHELEVMYGGAFDRADEAQPAHPQPEEAHEPLHRWRVEILDGDEWMPCSRTFGARSLAVDRYRSSSERTPAWADGEPVQRRLVRETTTYTVEAEHASALEPRQDGAGS